MRKALLLLILTLITLVSCASNPEFTKYIHKFNKISGVKSNIPVYKAPLLFGAGGCFLFFVIIDEEYWDGMDAYYNIDAIELQKESLVFHELGHCSLRRWLHTNNLDRATGCPVSLMHSQAIPTKCLKLKQNQYYKELNNENI